MDANGLRFWMLSNEQDFTPLAGADGVPGVHYCDETRRLTLRSSPLSAPNPERFDTATGLVEKPPFARDQFGNYARWDEGSGHVVAGGSGDGEIPLYAPPAHEPVTDLALSSDGVLYVAVGGKLVFIDRLARWQPFTLLDAATTFFRVVAQPAGGVVALDRDAPKLVRVRGLPLPDLPLRPAAAGVLRPCDENADPPRVELLFTLPSDEVYVALADDGAGRVALLSWGKRDATNDEVFLRMFAGSNTVAPSRRAVLGVRFPYSVAWLDGDQVALFATNNKAAFVYDLEASASDSVDSSPLPPAGDSYVLESADSGPFAHGFGQPPYYANGFDLVPLLPLSLNALRGTGSARGSQTIDGGVVRAAWHRVYVEAVIPPRCGVVVWLAASDDASTLGAPDTVWFPHLFGDAEVPAEFSDAPRGAWQRVPSEVSFHPGLLGKAPEAGRSGLFTALVQRADRVVRTLRGRHLAVRVELSGNRRNTPEVAAVRVYGPRFSYVERYLPELYRETLFGVQGDARGTSTRADFFERFVDIVEAQMTQMEDRVAASYLLTDVRATTDAAVDWLGSFLGVVPEAEPVDRRRARVAATSELYQKRGRLDGLTLALDVATRGACTRGAIVLLEDYRIRHTFATVLGAELAPKDDPLLPGHWESANSFVGDTLFLGDEHHAEFLSLYAPELLSATEQQQVDAFLDSLAYRLTVFIHDSVEAVDLELVKRVVEREKPAHVAVAYKRATEPFLVGMASLLGVNTYLAPVPELEIARVDESRIGRAVIAQLPSLDPRLDDTLAAARYAAPVARITGPRSIRPGDPIELDGSASTAPAGTTLTNFEWTILPR